jgi:hypothetical protein
MRPRPFRPDHVDARRCGADARHWPSFCTGEQSAAPRASPCSPGAVRAGTGPRSSTRRRSSQRGNARLHSVALGQRDPGQRFVLPRRTTCAQRTRAAPAGRPTFAQRSGAAPAGRPTCAQRDLGQHEQRERVKDRRPETRTGARDQDNRSDATGSACGGGLGRHAQTGHARAAASDSSGRITLTCAGPLG